MKEPTTYRFTASPRDGQLNVSLCVASGQVFRWRTLPDESTLGFDGNHWYRVWQADPALGACTVESSAPYESFARLFRFDADLKQIESEILRLSPELSTIVADLNGLRLMRPSEPIESFFSFLCTPNNHLRRILPMVARLASYGPCVGEVGGCAWHRFPSAERIAEIPEVELRSYGFGYRAKSIPNVAQQVMARGGDDWIRRLAKMDYERAVGELVSLIGIGRKLADCIALFALGMLEAAPLDTHLLQAMTRLYFPELRGKSLTDKRYRLISGTLRSRYGNLAGFAQQYLYYDNLRKRRAGVLASPRVM